MVDSSKDVRVTPNICVVTEARYIPERSSPENQEYLFAYHVKISNEGQDEAQLLSRHWIIINADGDRQDVQGPGVVGATPILKPGDSFEYDSFCPLNTAWGTMEGSYRMRRADASEFDVLIARFFLVMPNLKSQLARQQF